MDDLIELLNRRTVTLTFRKIQQDTGIPAGWLSMLVRKKMTKRPSKDRLNKLREYLKTEAKAS